MDSGKGPHHVRGGATRVGCCGGDPAGALGTDAGLREVRFEAGGTLSFMNVVYQDS